MTATVPAARKPKSRVMRNVEVETPIDGLTIVRFVVAEGKRVDAYRMVHWSDSCEVRVTHADDPARKYTVLCSVASREPTLCSCPSRVRCRHMDAVAKLTELGHLQFPTLEDAGHDRGCAE